jgi:hypothetical protein
MFSAMQRELTHLPKLFCAIRALVRLDSSMNEMMLFQVLFADKSLAANRALEWPLVQMDNFHVFFQVELALILLITGFDTTTVANHFKLFYALHLLFNGDSVFLNMLLLISSFSFISPIIYAKFF